MILHKNYIPATAWEKLRIAAMMKGGCILTMYRRDRGLAVPPPGKIECQHIVRNNKRMGHIYTIPLHVYYHQGRVPLGYDPEGARLVFGATLKDSMRVFRESHGVDDLDLWLILQNMMGMSTDLPLSKIYKRPEAQTEADVAVSK